MDYRQIKIVKLCELKEHPKNPRIHPKSAIEKLKMSLQTYGFTNPVLASEDGYILAGHARCKAAVELGFEEVPVIYLNLSGESAEAYLIADNRLHEETVWDDNKLAELFADFDAKNFDASVTGFDAVEIDELLNKYYAKDAVEDDFDVEKAKSEIESAGAVTQRRDVWLLGKHRLMCGDSASASDFEKLMDGKHAQLAVTSPPSGADKDYEKNGIESWFGKMTPVISNVCRHADIVCWNIADIFSTASRYIEPTSVYSVNLFAEHGFRPIWIRVWKKMLENVGTNSKPSQQYEWLTAFEGESVTEESYNLQDYSQISAFAGHNYKFVRRLTKDERKSWGYAAIWEIKAARSNKDNPSMLPVTLPFRCIKIHSDSGGIVFDPFCGSFSTGIACEQTERVCYAMEKSPVYCDLAVRRWEEWTGNKAVKLEEV